MMAFREKLAEAFAACSLCVSQCCLPVTTYIEEKQPHQPRGPGTSFAVIHDAPSFVAPPSAPPAEPIRPAAGPSKPERAPRRQRHGSGHSSFSVRKRLLPLGGSSSTSLASRRPQISAPSDFRHLYSESFNFPENSPEPAPVVHARPSSFHPIELNIALGDNRLSPLLPSFASQPSPPVTPPPRAMTVRSSPGGSSQTASHTRSYSSMSFHIPRRPVAGGSVFDSPRSDASTPQRPPRARVRAATSPGNPPDMMEDLVEKVAQAMMERDRLQEQLDDVIERQSIYTSSRPSSAQGFNDMEPMPDIPALPPNAPSFKERLSSDRPGSAPPRDVHRSHNRPPPVPRLPYAPNSSRKVEGRGLPPPPLPLQLRPPLRKKKSFSHVSTWLGFQGGAGAGASATGEPHRRDISLDSITNAPRPVRGEEGFYQVAAGGFSRRSSLDDTVSVVSDWSASAGEQTVPTSWSPSSEVTAKALADPFQPTGVAGLRYPGRTDLQLANTAQPRRSVVGIAV